MTAGTYYFEASYSGDANNTAAASGCTAEPLTVSPDQPTLSTQLSATTVAVGGSVYDTAILSGGASNAGGTVTYRVYDNDTCASGSRAWSPRSVRSASSTAAFPTRRTGPPPSQPARTTSWPPTPVTPSDTPTASGCAAEPLTVSPDQPTLSTQLSATTVAVGGSVYDTAVLSGGASNAGGTVTYLVYDNDTCASGSGGLVTTLGPVSVTNGSVPDSPDWTPTAAGAYYFVASYSGDASDTTAVSGCAAEPLTVSPDQPSVSTQLSTATVVLGGAVYDSATLSGASPDASGTVTYLVYDNDTCAGGAGLVATLGPVSVTDGSVRGLAGLDAERGWCVLLRGLLLR